MTSDPVVLIPARLESRRLPGKALAELGGMPIVIRCANNAISAGLHACVCSDSPAILHACRDWGVEHLATPAFATGTDRCTWAAQQLQADSLVVLQGDEPLISPSALSAFSAALVSAGSPAKTILNGISPLAAAAAENPNNVKVVQRQNGQISKLTRMPVLSNVLSVRLGQEAADYFKQLGLYGALRSSFEIFAALEMSPLEQVESIEMLRWIDAGLLLQGVLLETPAISVDTQSDLDAAQQWLAHYSASSVVTPVG